MAKDVARSDAALHGESAHEPELVAAAAPQRGPGEQHRGALRPSPTETFTGLVRRGHVADDTKPLTARARELRQREIDAVFTRLETYAGFGERVKETKRKLLEFLIAAKRAGRTVARLRRPRKVPVL